MTVLCKGCRHGWFRVGEFWVLGLEGLMAYLEKMEHKFSLFKAPPVGNFHKIPTGDKASEIRGVYLMRLWSSASHIMR
jgi:alpha-amylase